MTLPVTITGISPDLATVGPFQSAAGNFYFFGKDASTATTLQCYKATDPTVGWSSIATKTGYATNLLDIAAFQVGDVIHLAIVDGAYAGLNFKYTTFDMATEAFVVAETIASSVAANDDGPPLCSIVVRSNGQAVVLLQGPLHDTSHQSIHYSVRTGANNWSALAEADDAGTGYDYLNPVAILGDSDEIHFLYYSTGTAQRTYQRALSPSNVLQTSTYVAGANYVCEGISFDFGGTTRCVVAPTYGYTLYFDAGDTPTLNVSSNSWIAYVNEKSLRLFESGGIVYLLYSKTAGSNKDYYFRSSSDGGATWSAETFICSSVNDGKLQNTSRFARLFPLAGDVILPFIYADAGSIKHNRKIVASANVDYSPASATASGVSGSIAGKIIQFGIAAVNASGAAASPPKSVSVQLAGQSGDAQVAVTVAEGGSVSVNLESITADIGSAGFGLGLETTGTAGSGQVTRLGAGGYPIAALPSGAAVPETRVSLFSVASVAAVAAPSGYTADFPLPVAITTAAAALPIWANTRTIGPIYTTAAAANLSRSIQHVFEAAISATASGSLVGANYVWLTDLAVSAISATGDFAISLGRNVTLETAVSTAFANELLPFVGRFAALESTFTSATAADMAAQSSIVLSSAASVAVSDEIRFEGDETFNLAAAAAAGVVGDLTCAITIPSEIVICAMNAAMTANSLVAGLIPNDLDGEIGMGNLVAAMATGALQSEARTGSMQTTIRCH